MQSVNWQLVIAGTPVQPGKSLHVNEKWQNDAGAFVVLQPTESEQDCTFCVRYNVNIGGKNYLLLENSSEPAGVLTVVRLFGTDTISAMDPDRFSSLRNALIEFLNHEPPTALDELSKVLGGLEIR